MTKTIRNVYIDVEVWNLAKQRFGSVSGKINDLLKEALKNGSVGLVEERKEMKSLSDRILDIQKLISDSDQKAMDKAIKESIEREEAERKSAEYQSSKEARKIAFLKRIADAEAAEAERAKLLDL